MQQLSKVQSSIRAIQQPIHFPGNISTFSDSLSRMIGDLMDRIGVVVQILNSAIPTIKWQQVESLKWKNDLEKFKNNELSTYELNNSNYLKIQKKYFTVCQKIEDTESDIFVLTSQGIADKKNQKLLVNTQTSLKKLVTEQLTLEQQYQTSNVKIDIYFGNFN